MYGLVDFSRQTPQHSKTFSGRGSLGPEPRAVALERLAPARRGSVPRRPGAALPRRLGLCRAHGARGGALPGWGWSGGWAIWY